MTNEFDDRTALVTGGGTGIGRAVAVALADAGCLVTVAGRTDATLVETVELIEATGGAARYVLCDVTIESMVQAAVDAAIGDADRLDFAVNSAGIDGGDESAMTADYPTKTLDQMLAVNVRGMFLSMKYQLRAMRTHKAGSIVNISSGAGLVGIHGYSGYSASKFAEIGLTKSSALEYAADGIRINAVCPGLVDTPLIAALGAESGDFAARVADHPMKRIARSSEVSDAVLWLCSDRSSYVTGVALPVDGGYTAQ